jgi:mannose/cellobiose epimerase-like protein (N-acyl-D-glucosamine 2-epimerase family)
LIRAFRAPDGEGWVWSCRGDGSVLDDTYDAYGHAFVLLALSTAAATFSDARYRELAFDTRAFMQHRFSDRHGGLIWHIDRDGRVKDDVRSQNPMMHTFEALLALEPLDESRAVRAAARQIWRFLEARMPGAGALPEWFDPEWRPLSSGKRALVEVGHVFEWAFLLSEARELFPDEDLLERGRQLLAFGMRHGYDAEQGGIYARVGYDGEVLARRKGWWEQCEAIRAMHRYVTRHGAVELAEPLQQSLDFVRRHFVDEAYGGWYSNPPGMGDEPSLVKGHVYKLDYHVVNMCRELLAE